MKGFEPFRELGRDLRASQAQRERPHGAGSTARRRGRESRGPGSARTARAASSTRPGATTSGPGATPAFTTWSSAAFAGPPAQGGRVRQRPQDRRTDVPAVRVRRGRRAQLSCRGRSGGRRANPITADAEAALAGRIAEAPASCRRGFEAELFAAEPDDRQADLR